MKKVLEMESYMHLLSVSGAFKKCSKVIDLEGERERERERERLICCFTYFCIHWLLLLCARPGIEPATLAYRNNGLINYAAWGQGRSIFSSLAHSDFLSPFPPLQCIVYYFSETQIKGCFHVVTLQISE